MIDYLGPSVMDKLNLEHVILFITTHDFELCDYEKVKLANYHFSEHYIDNKIKFDYKIKDGKCNTTNAVYLMKNTGIMD
jgi:DNA mismatch repair ATPase MutS